MSFPLPSLAALQLVCDAEKLWGMLMSPWEGEHPRWEQSQQSSAGKRVGVLWVVVLPLGVGLLLGHFLPLSPAVLRRVMGGSNTGPGRCCVAKKKKKKLKK